MSRSDEALVNAVKATHGTRRDCRRGQAAEAQSARTSSFGRSNRPNERASPKATRWEAETQQQALPEGHRLLRSESHPWDSTRLPTRPAPRRHQARGPAHSADPIGRMSARRQRRRAGRLKRSNRRCPKGTACCVVKATHGTRTHDLCFTKALLYH